ncbi:phospholipase [Microbacterium sp. ZW T6_19]|uniref:aggregation-promoting factor C-terminal-like domain-containing protein n=1 Tax=Microbacterium sp. ZW T6_19 TaxID=3378082 RepID=UPI003852C36C
MLQNTRALRRAAAAASARSTVTARRPILMFAAAGAALLGITVTVGFVSAPAAGAENMISAVTELAGPEPLAKVADEASTSLIAAHAAVDAAIQLNADVVLSGLDLGESVTSIDTGELHHDINALDERAVMPGMLLTVLTADTEKTTAAVVAETATLQAALTAAQEKKAADDAAKAAAEQAAAQAAAAAAALAAVNTPDGARAAARDMAASRYGWGDDQFQCLNSLWNKESSWNYQAYNPSGATGIPQALPGSKMASAGGDWATNAATQIAWGLGYISSVYGTPCSAWGHSQTTNWY